MRVTQSVNLSQIRHGKRLPLNPKVLRFALQLLKGYHFPPVSVERLADGSFKLHNGRHRVAAHKLVGSKTIRVHVAIREEPNPYKPLAHAEEKPVVVSGESLYLTPTAKE